MNWFRTCNSDSYSSPFRGDTIEMFPKPISCDVTQSIRPDDLGRVKTNGGVIWRAELYDANSKIALPSGHPAQAIGRRNNILVVIPRHHG